jgi:hypothetical protein
VIVFKGKSRFDNKPIAVIATGFERASKNIKTGEMIQLTTIPINQSPSDSNKNHIAGENHVVCGDCPLINHGCYVRVEQAPDQIWKAMHAGNYEEFDIDAFINERVRFGAWAEPTLIPVGIVKKIVGVIKNWTGYSHQYAKKWAQPYKNYFMASVSNIADKNKANKLGWRTFRVVKDVSEKLPDEVICPNYTHKIECYDCCLCRGSSLKAKNVCIPAHGGKAKLGAMMKILNNGD